MKGQIFVFFVRGCEDIGDYARGEPVEDWGECGEYI
jgi:hypothetical protein